MWLPNQEVPVRCGSYALEDCVGRFQYAQSYVDLHDAVALDPLHLPLAGQTSPIIETQRRGLFGVFRDSSPCDFGKSLLEARHGRSLDDDPLRQLELADGDLIGAVAVGAGVQGKASYQPPDADELLSRLARLPEEVPCGQAVCDIKGVPRLDRGPERPRLTVLHEGRHWLAKVQDPRPGGNGLVREFIAMSLGAAAGLEVAEVRFFQAGKRNVLLVRRFDREIGRCGGSLRQLYLSAHTVLGLGHRDFGAERVRWSYVALAGALEGFTGGPRVSIEQDLRELWRRMVFNVLCGNDDDHPSNHGFIFSKGAWRLSPAFDIHPSGSYRGQQALAVNRAGSRVGSRANLLADCEIFGWGVSEARQYIEDTRGIVLGRWATVLQKAGLDLEPPPIQDPSGWLESPGADRHEFER